MSNEINNVDQDGGGSTTDRRTLLRTAGIAGVAGAALAGSMHGKFALAPISEAQAQTATSMPKGTSLSTPKVISIPAEIPKVSPTPAVSISQL